MSEALMSTAVLQPQSAAKTGATREQGGQAKTPETADFPMVFGSMMLQNADSGSLPAELQGLTAQELARLADSPEAQQLLSQLQFHGDERGKTLPGGLPQLAFRGVIAVDDGEQAAAMTLQGDAQALRATSPVVSQDLSQALRQAFAQQQAMAANQGDKPANLQQLVSNNPAVNNENFKLELNNLTQAFTDQLAREADKELAQGIKTNTSPTTQSANTTPHNSNSSLNALTSMNNHLNGAARSDTGNGGNSVSVPPQHPQWGQQVGDRVQWMVGQNLQRADIRLNPPELGSLEVRIQVNGDQQTNISFSSPHAQVRDALEAALPRLREMMNDSGLNLGDVDVSQHAFAHSQMQEGSDGNGGEHQAGKNSTQTAEPVLDASEENAGVATIRNDVLVDYYA